MSPSELVAHARSSSPPLPPSAHVRCRLDASTGCPQLLAVIAAGIGASSASRGRASSTGSRTPQAGAARSAAPPSRPLPARSPASSRWARPHLEVVASWAAVGATPERLHGQDPRASTPGAGPCAVTIGAHEAWSCSAVTGCLAVVSAPPARLRRRSPGRSPPPAAPSPWDRPCSGCPGRPGELLVREPHQLPRYPAQEPPCSPDGPCACSREGRARSQRLSALSGPSPAGSAGRPLPHLRLVEFAVPEREVLDGGEDGAVAVCSKPDMSITNPPPLPGE